LVSWFFLAHNRSPAVASANPTYKISLTVFDAVDCRQPPTYVFSYEGGLLEREFGYVTDVINQF
jgi:hypothetical protein